MIRRQEPPPTIAIATVTEATPETVTIFAEVNVSPSVGSVWGAFVEDGIDGRSKVAEDFVPGSEHIIYGVTFQVDTAYEAVTWSQNGGVTSSTPLPHGHNNNPISTLPGTASSAPSNTVDSPGTGASGSADTKSSSKSNIGPIVGGAVGGVVALAIIVFLVWFLLRRRKAKQAGASAGAPAVVGTVGYQSGQGSQGVAELAHTGVERKPMPVYELNHAKENQAGMTVSALSPEDNHSYGEQIKRVPVPMPELASSGQVQGHDQTAWRQELGADTQRDGDYESRHEQLQQQQQQQVSSPHVEAQRRLEMEWLESEEARLRSRRELLRQQEQQQHGT